MSKLLLTMLRNAGLYNRASHSGCPFAVIDAAYHRSDWKSMLRVSWCAYHGDRLINIVRICNAADWGCFAGEMRKDFPV